MAQGKRRVAVAIGIGLALALAAALAFVLLGGGSQTGSSSSGGSEQASGEGGGSTTFAADVTDEEAWVLDFFLDVGRVRAAGDMYPYWSEENEDDDELFCVDDAASGQSLRYGLYYLSWDPPETLAIPEVLEELNAELVEDYGGDVFEQAGEGAEPDYVVTDVDGTQVGYVFNDCMRAAANDARSVADALRDEDPDDADNFFLGINEYGLTESMMEESVSITPEGKTISKGELSVYFKVSTSKERIREIVAELGCTLQWDDDDNLAFLYLNALGFQVENENAAATILVTVDTPDGEDEWDVAERFEEYSEVKRAKTEEVDTRFRAYEDSATNGDVSVTSDDASWQYYLEYSGFEEAWDTVTCNGDVTVCVYDCGFDCSNEELSPNIEVEETACIDFGELEACSVADLTDADAHGTKVSGIVSALAGDGTGVDGASYNASLLPVKYITDSDELRKSYLQDAIAFYEYILSLDDPPDVINISSHVAFETKAGMLLNFNVMRLQYLISKAYARGIVTVASAGNIRDEDDDRVDDEYYNVPACLDDVVSVGSLAAPADNSAGYGSVYRLSSFSNTVSEVDICAYGEDIDTTGTDERVRGTSFSAPQVASAVALLMAEHPSWDADAVVEALLGTADAVVEMDGAAVEGAGAGALDAAAAVTVVSEDGDDDDDDDGGSPFASFWEFPTSSMEVDSTLLTTYAVRDGSIGSEFLGISNTNFDFWEGSVSSGATGFDTIGGLQGASSAASYLSGVDGAPLAIWATDLNESPNPYYANLCYHLIAGTYSTAGAASLGAATTWMANPDSSSWGDSDGSASYDAEGNETIAGLEYEPDVVFGAGKYANWGLEADGSNSGSAVFLAESADDDYDPLYVNDDATNLWTRVYTLGQLAAAADGLGGATRYGDATASALAYEKATRGQLLYLASLIDSGELAEKTVAYLYAIDADGTGYFFVPSAEGLLSGEDTGRGDGSSGEADGCYAANTAAVSYGYMDALPFVSTTFDSGDELEGGIVMQVQDIGKRVEACTVGASSASEALAGVDVIIYNTTTATDLAAAATGGNSSGVSNDYNGDALSADEVAAWAAAFGFDAEEGAIVAGDDFGDGTLQGTGSARCTTSAGTAPLLASARDYTADKAARAAWAFSAVYPEAYGGNDDACYGYYVDAVYHVQTARVASVMTYMTNQSDAVVYTSTTGAFVEACANAGYEWWVTEGCADEEWSAYAYYNGSSRASYYSGDEEAEEPVDTIGIFAPSALWAAEMGDA